MVVGVKIEVLVSMCGFSVNAGSNGSIGFLAVIVSRKTIDPLFSSSAVNVIC